MNATYAISDFPPRGRHGFRDAMLAMAGPERGRGRRHHHHGGRDRFFMGLGGPPFGPGGPFHPGTPGAWTDSPRVRGSAQIHDPAFGTWTCAGGEKEGQVCEPTDLTSCGTGTCRSQIRESFGCIGYGPKVNNSFLNYFQIGGAQRAQSEIDFAPGVSPPAAVLAHRFINQSA